MRKVFLVVALAALVASTAAQAKERSLSMVGRPAAPHVGQPWNVTITVKVDGRAAHTIGKTPALRLIATSARSLTTAGHAITVLSTPTGSAGVYRARAVFPRAGFWRVLVIDRETGRAYESQRVNVRAA
jgi:hypothetical protein